MTNVPTWKINLWDAINRYAETCGGDPSQHVYSNYQRMAAVVQVERAVEAAQVDLGNLDGPQGDVLRAVMQNFVVKFPLPWRVERDWTYEVVCVTSGEVIAKFERDTDAQNFVKYGTEAARV